MSIFRSYKRKKIVLKPKKLKFDDPTGLLQIYLPQLLSLNAGMLIISFMSIFIHPMVNWVLVLILVFTKTKKLITGY